MNNPYFLLLLTIALIPIQISAAENLCEDMHRRICSGNRNQPDSTGYSMGDQSHFVVDELVKGAKDDIIAAGDKVWSRMTAEQKKNYFAELDSCRKQSQTPNCQEDVRKSLRRFVISQIAVQGLTGGGFDEKFPWASTHIQLNFDLVKGAGIEDLALNVVKKIKARANQNKAVESFDDKIFQPVKAQVAQLLPLLSQNPTHLKTAQQMLDKASFGGTECGKGIDKNYLDHFASNDAIFDVSSSKVFVCYGRFRANSSAYSLAALAAHEIAHSIDPCKIVEPTFQDTAHFLGGSPNAGEWSEKKARTWPWVISAGEKKSGYADLIRCMRDKRSIKVNNLTDRFDPERKHFVLCTDQAPEAFADWLSVEIMVRLLKKNFFKAKDKKDLQAGIDNSFRGLCGGPPVPSLHAHKSDEDRINKLLAVHPYIREKLGCPPLDAKTEKYCDVLQKEAEPAVPLGDDSSSDQ